MVCDGDLRRSMTTPRGGVFEVSATRFEVGTDVPESAADTLFACLVGAYDGQAECKLGPEESYQPLSHSLTTSGYDAYGLLKTQTVEAAGSTSVTERTFLHQDPADRLIAATALIHRALLLTADEKLRQTPNLVTLWD